MPKALFISPHFDDVAFSCGGTFRALAVRGWETTLCTVFTRSVPNPGGFALACQLDKGLGPDVDYLAIRRAEDDRAAAALGATSVERLDLPEAPHRGYRSAAALFGAFADEDDVASELQARLARHVEDCDAIFAPQGLGNHVDHRRVRDATLALLGARSAHDRAMWYRDTPYAIRNPDAVPNERLVAAFPSAFTVALNERTIEAKLDACAAYATQLGFQFGGAAAMREALYAFARAEGTRLDEGRPSESFVATSVARERLTAWNRSAGQRLRLSPV